MEKINFKSSYIKKYHYKISKNDLISDLSNQFIMDDAVIDEYPTHVIERERIFPTGIFVGDIGIAIPHTEAKYVKENSIAVGILSYPIEFGDMGDDESFVDVELVFLLAFGSSNKHLNFLGQIMNLIKLDGFLYSLKEMNEEAIFDSLKDKINR